MLVTSGIDGIYPRGLPVARSPASSATPPTRSRKIIVQAARRRRPAAAGARARQDGRHAGAGPRSPGSGPRKSRQGRSGRDGRASECRSTTPAAQDILLPVKGGSSFATLAGGARVSTCCPGRTCRGVAGFPRARAALWCIQQPRTIGVGVAWVLGLVMDAATARCSASTRSPTRCSPTPAWRCAAASCAFRCGSRRCTCVSAARSCTSQLLMLGDPRCVGGAALPRAWTYFVGSLGRRRAALAVSLT